MYGALGFIILNTLVEVISSMNSQAEKSFCAGRLFDGGSAGRRFELSENCDMEPLAKPYRHFPPSVYVIGAQKAGTSAVTFLLEHNTVLQTGFRKEIRFLKFRPGDFRFSGTPRQK